MLFLGSLSQFASSYYSNLTSRQCRHASLKFICCGLWRLSEMKKWARLRKRKRITQFSLAAESGVPRWRIAYAEVGYLKLRPEEMAAIRRVLTAGPGNPSRLESEAQPIGAS